MFWVSGTNRSFSIKSVSPINVCEEIPMKKIVALVALAGMASAEIDKPGTKFQIDVKARIAG